MMIYRKKSRYLVNAIDIISKLLLPSKKQEQFDCSRNKIKKILIIEGHGIGDFIMAGYGFRALKKKFPNAKIYLLTMPFAKQLLIKNKIFSKIILFNSPWMTGKYNLQGIYNIIKRLRKEEFDLAINFRGDIRELLFMYLINSKCRVSYDYGAGRSFLTHIVPYDRKKQNQVEQNMEIIRFLTGKKVPSESIYSFSKSEIQKFKKKFKDKSADKIIGIHPGAKWNRRRWPIERFAQLCKLLNEKKNLKVVFFYGYEDKKNLNEFRKKDNLTCHAIFLPLSQLPMALAACDLFIGNDSGPMHIAAAVKTPVVALFGPQDPRWHGPYGEKNIVLYKKTPCSPCSQTKCNKKIKCMDLITVEEVFEQVKNKLK